MIIRFSEEMDSENRAGSEALEQRQRDLLLHAAEEVLRSEAVLEDEPCDVSKDFSEGGLSVSLSFASADEIRELNRTYRDRDAVTDVLSFPMYEDVLDLKEDVSELYRGDTDDGRAPAEISLGDVVICRDKVASQALEYGHSEDRELIYLFVHSMLHLLGYDHMEDEEKSRMRAREEEIMDRIGLGR